MFTWGSHTLSRLEFGVYQGKIIWPWHVPNLGERARERGFQDWSHSSLDQNVNFNSDWRCCSTKPLYWKTTFMMSWKPSYLPKKRGSTFNLCSPMLCICQGQISFTLADQIYFINGNFKCVWSNPPPPPHRVRQVWQLLVESNAS